MTSLSSMSLLKKYSPLSSNDLRGSIFWGATNGVFVALQSWVLAFMIDGLFFKNKDVSFLSIYLFLFLFSVSARAVVSYFCAQKAYLGGEKVKFALQRDLYGAVYDKGPLFVTEQGSGALTTVLLDAPETIRSYYEQFIPASWLAVFVPIVILVAVFPYDWVSALIMLATAPVIPLFMILIGTQAEKKSQNLWETLTRMGNVFLDSIQGMQTLHFFGATTQQERIIEKSSEKYRSETMSVLRVAFLSSVILEFFSAVSIAVIAVLIGFRLLWGEMDFFNGFFVLLLAPEFYLPLRKLSSAYHSKMESQAAAKMADVVLAPAKNAHIDTIPLTEPIKTIEFRDVCFSYDGDRHALSHLNLTINAGESLVICGKSGAGKSTIFSLLMGFISPSSGNILINGNDLSSLQLNDWRKKISWIPQNPSLFYGSILQNLKLGIPDNTPIEIIREQCRKMQIDGYISSLPDGYDTFIGENGAGLSGGQIQRIALTRAILRRSPLLLLDEPVASLDSETEKIVSEYLSEQKVCEKIILTITHRIHTIHENDRVIYLENGETLA